MSSRKHSFLVSLWTDDDDDESLPTREWRRGSVEDIETRRRLYFNEIVQLVDFLMERVGRRNSP